jgi:hypothetical protein
MGMGTGNALGQQSTGGKGGAQPANNQVYYDSSKSQYYTMGQPQQQSSGPFSVFGSTVQGMGGKGKGGDGRTYIGNSPNNGTTNSLSNYTAPQFQQQPNPYMSYYAQQQQQRNPYAQTQFGQMPGQQPQYNQQQGGMGGKGKGGGMSPQQGGGMFGGLRQQQNPYSPQINYGQQPEQPFMGGYDRGYPQQQQAAMGGKGGMGGQMDPRLDATDAGRYGQLLSPEQQQERMQRQQGGMGGKGAPDTSREAYNQQMALSSYSPGGMPSYEQWSAQRQQNAMGLKEGMGGMGGKGGQQQLPSYAQPYMQAMMQNQQRQQLPQYAQQGQPQSLSALQSMLRGMPR